MCVIAGVSLAVYGTTRGLIYAGSMLGSAAALMLVVGAERRRSRLEFDGERLVYRMFFRERVVWSVGETGRVVRVFVLGRAQKEPSPMWLLVRASGTVALRVDERMWGPDKLEALRVRLGLPVDQVTERITLPELIRRYPSSFPGWLARLT